MLIKASFCCYSLEQVSLIVKVHRASLVLAAVFFYSYFSDSNQSSEGLPRIVFFDNGVRLDYLPDSTDS